MSESHNPGAKPIPYPDFVSDAKAVYGGPKDCYRYSLAITWDDSLPTMMTLLMNPSVAGHEASDRTVNKMIRFAAKRGFGKIYIGNSAAYRATTQEILAQASDPIGPLNHISLNLMAQKSSFILAGYGSPKVPQMRGVGLKAAKMLSLNGHTLHALRLSADGSPWHPLYIPNATEPFVWKLT
jgi:hypothetical protein